MHACWCILLLALLAAWAFLRLLLAPLICRASGRKFALILSLLSRRCPMARANQPPNILMYVVDDLGFADAPFMGSADSLQMKDAAPNLSSMAATGVLLKSFYAQTTCTPTRAALLTGRLPIYLSLQDSVIHATEPRGLDLSHSILADKLAKSPAQYATIAIGKVQYSRL